MEMKNNVLSRDEVGSKERVSISELRSAVSGGLVIISATRKRGW